ncbi:MAG: response regulator [Rhodocyclaceae bacterium]|nr:response regulator [Rhodocyclaceae bacterium]
MASQNVPPSRVLLVDDQPMMTIGWNAVVMKLYPAAKIDRASTFDEASDLLALEDYDAMISDFRLSADLRINAMPLISMARAKSVSRIAIVSGDTRLSTVSACVREGAHCFIDKTLDEQEIGAFFTLFFRGVNLVPTSKEEPKNIEGDVELLILYYVTQKQKSTWIASVSGLTDVNARQKIGRLLKKLREKHKDTSAQFTEDHDFLIALGYDLLPPHLLSQVKD